MLKHIIRIDDQFIASSSQNFNENYALTFL